ncbi:mechanosensitive ion channel family protein [Candidatus Nanohalobium constans]|uniref:Mechanosensitive ion channel protein MscS n=1 Tax=Candidatus Nanohalobium constans TaxID=2565781 RepID=A0A5Q0UF72_9ARCH|nr:mechanosensitive ion channel domain-containing protein [Candidatus Nanohalobium constans]QGA80242.1 mechanosensitive ion channel protein MscS [Candidatus Nanohalobium constans]
MVLDQAIRFLVFDLGIKLTKTALFLGFAALGIRFASDILRSIASRKYSEPVVVELIADACKFFMWFWAILISLSILGFSGIATSMGTASGFVALGVAFALKNVISDTVAGAYLAQDPDFNSGDRVEVDGNEGVIEDVGLRKTRLRLENGDLRVINNSDAEKKWTLKSN